MNQLRFERWHLVYKTTLKKMHISLNESRANPSINKLNIIVKILNPRIEAWVL